MPQRALATILILLLSPIPLPARAAGASKVHPLGIITQASGAHFNAGTASAGGTVYDGDVLSTEEGGALQFRGNATMIYLAGGSSVTLGALASGTQALLRNGTVVISAARAMEIVGDGAAIRPLADVPTVAQVTIIGPKELQIHARRGALQLSYRAESATLAEGSTYRILLDPPEVSTVQEPRSDSKPHPGKNRPFKIVIIAAGIGIITSIVLHNAFESPDRP